MTDFICDGLSGGLASLGGDGYGYCYVSDVGLDGYLAHAVYVYGVVVATWARRLTTATHDGTVDHT